MKKLLKKLDEKIKQINVAYNFDRGLVLDRCSGIHDAKEIIKSEFKTDEIMAELYKALEKLGAKSDLLSIVGSYGDVMSDEDVLNELKKFNC